MLNKGGAGTFALSGNSSGSFTSSTINVNAGTLAAGSNNALGASSNTVTVGNSATFALSGVALSIPQNFTFNSGSSILENNANAANTMSGNLALNGTVGINVTNATNDQLTLSGILSGSSVTLNYTGPGTLVLSGSSANTYTGTTNIASGIISARKE